MIGALSRGLSYDAIEKMTIGQVVDFCIVYNKKQSEDENGETEKPKSRVATQTDWNAFFGR